MESRIVKQKQVEEATARAERAEAALAAATKISLSRVLNGYYCYNTPNFAQSFEVIQQGAGLWSVKEVNGAAWLVEKGAIVARRVQSAEIHDT